MIASSAPALARFFLWSEVYFLPAGDRIIATAMVSLVGIVVSLREGNQGFYISTDVPL